MNFTYIYLLACLSGEQEYNRIVSTKLIDSSEVHGVKARDLLKFVVEIVVTSWRTRRCFLELL